ncbi:MAG TPA: LysR family transcriptional regulator, partial [Verrucomicrobiales bacterium]|nr:LysR family transcriptional regulator [Verrucomicrobiales bacterium]
FGVQLLARTRRVVRLTAAGKALLEETSLMFERLDQTISRVRRAATGQIGELRLGYIGPATQQFLGRLLEEYGRRSPDVTVHLEERTPERVWEMVAKGRLDIGLTRPVLAHVALRMEMLRLRDERLCAAIPPRHPWVSKKSVPWSSLATQSLIILARREGAGLHDEILAACRKAGFVPKLGHTPSLISTILRYVESGAGIGVIPECLAETEKSDRWRAVQLTPPQTIPLVMVWPGEHQEPPAIAFRELVAEWIRNGRLWRSD